MAKDRSSGRVEPKFGTDAPADLHAAPEDRPVGNKGRAAKRGRKAADPAPAGRGRKAQRARRSLFARLVRGTIYWGLVACLWVGIGVVGVVGYYAAQLPGTGEWKVPERPPNVQIVASDGRLMGNRGDTGGESVRIANLPDYVPNAVIAIEDRRFRSHFGLDPIGLVRAVAKNAVAGGVVEGGSTLTQQLAKNMFLSPERSLRRKVQEVVLAVWLETKYTKDEILEMYLNRVYFGAGAYGIDAAARRYFDRNASELTLPQAAMLAGVLPAPSALAPNRNPEGARQRAALVLQAMRDQGFIDAKEAEVALNEPAQASNLHMTRSDNYVADWVMEVLAYHVGTVDQDVVVETTIDLALQDAAQTALSDVLKEKGPEYKVSDGAMVALDGTGAIRAMVGGRNYAKSQFNRTVQARRQPGSAFKPFVYLAALERGYSPETILIDEPVTIGNWSPKNSTGKYIGPITLKAALAHSVNTVAAQLAAAVGPEAVVHTAQRLGINSPLAPNPSIALGTSEVTLLELTGAYAPFSNGGFAAMPYVIQKIRTVEGKVLFDRSGSGLGRVVSAENVALMNDMMRATVERGTGKRAAFEGWPTAGKTGTSQDFRDAWFIGYTANLTAGVWVGNDSNQPTKRATGGTLPSLIWSKFMAKAHEGVPVAELPGTEMVPSLLAAQRQQPTYTGGMPQPGAQPQPAEGDSRQLDDWIVETTQRQVQRVQEIRPIETGRSLLDRIFGR